MNVSRSAIPVSDRIGSRAHRRAAVIALYGAFVVGSITYGLTEHTDVKLVRVLALAVILGCFGAGAWGFWQLMRRTLINAPNIADADLDERYRQRGRDATRRAYFFLAIAACTAPLYVEIAATAQGWGWMRNVTLVTDLAWALFLLALTLPSAIMAWTEPEPPLDA